MPNEGRRTLNGGHIIDSPVQEAKIASRSQKTSVPERSASTMADKVVSSSSIVPSFCHDVPHVPVTWIKPVTLVLQDECCFLF